MGLDETLRPLLLSRPLIILSNHVPVAAKGRIDDSCIGHVGMDKSRHLIRMNHGVALEMPFVLDLVGCAPTVPPLVLILVFGVLFIHMPKV
jgi:hypothetical protein